MLGSAITSLLEYLSIEVPRIQTSEYLENIVLNKSPNMLYLQPIIIADKPT